jgi:hypothetical protein
MSHEIKNIDNDNVEQTEQNTPEQINFEKFLAIMDGSFLFDGGKKQIHNANPGFLSGAELGVVQQLGNKLSDALEYFQENNRKSIQYNKNLSQSGLPKMGGMLEETNPVPKGWVKGFSLFSRDKKKSESASVLSEHKSKTPHKP